MTLPGAIIVGAARSGTTTAFYGLASHPEIFAPAQKELNYWCRDDDGQLPSWFTSSGAAATPRTRAAYEAAFAGARPGQVAIEASPSYFSAGPASRIRAAIPDARIICILRQPVELCWSQFKTYWHGEMPSDALGRFAAELDRPSRNFPLKWHGLHGQNVEGYLRSFPRSQVEVLLFDDLVTRPDLFFARLFAHIGVDWRHQVPDRRVNASGLPRMPMLHRLLSGSGWAKRLARRVLPRGAVGRLLALHHRLRGANLRPWPELPTDLRLELTERHFAADLGRLAGMLERDPPHWW